jgi:ribulose 1,5-bisphosphate carboxylase large subunit-like protein
MEKFSMKSASKQLVYTMYRVYRRISEVSELVQETFMGTMDLKPDDIVLNDQHAETSDGKHPQFLKIIEIDYETRKKEGAVGIHMEPCDDPRGRLVNASGIRA